jgi:hypothetical protein
MEVAELKFIFICRSILSQIFSQDNSGWLLIICVLRTFKNVDVTARCVTKRSFRNIFYCFFLEKVKLNKRVIFRFS